MHRLVAAMVLVVAGTFVTAARADGECGETEVEAGASCEVAVGADCEAACDGGASCEAACAGDGALFCDGAFIDVQDLERCLDYLGSIGIVVEATGSAECRGDDCTGEPKGDDADGGAAPAEDDGGCSASAAGTSSARGAAFAVLVALCAVARRRRS